MPSPGQSQGASAPPRVGVQWLTPDSTNIFEGTFSLLHCAVKGDTLYRGVYAVRLFPVRWHDRFISLRHFDENATDVQIGVIENLADFPEGPRELIRSNLSKYYHQQVVKRVYAVECEFGLLFFDVETQRGREQFVIPWQTDRVQDYGKNGKVLIESLGNHYIIPDLAALPPADNRRFTNYIYW